MRAAQGFAWLETLWTTIAERAATRPPGSYTSRLLDGGVDAVARKVTEEATEVLIAAKDDAAAEAADRRRPAPPSPARRPTCCTTRWSCSRSVASNRPRSLTSCAPATLAEPQSEHAAVPSDDRLVCISGAVC